MSELAWALTILIVAIALVGALCNALVRNTVAAFLLSAGCSLGLWWYFAGQTDPFWAIAALVVVPIIIAVSIFMSLLGRAAHRAIAGED